MAIIHELGRPLISLLRDQPLDWQLPPQFRLPELDARIRKLAQAVGRLNLDKGPAPYLGTVVAVGERSVISAKHTIESLIERTGGNAKLSHQYGPYLNFSVEGKGGTRIEIDDLLFVHPVLDVAALRTKTPLPAPASRLISRPPRSIAGRVIAAIGYPSRDRREPHLTDQILQGPEHTLHVSVGQVQSVEKAPSPTSNEATVQLFHDCSTLGGFSGGPLLDVMSGDVIGIHVGGMARHHNFATPSWEIGRDPRVRVHPVTFTVPASPWDHLWEPLFVAPHTAPPRDGTLTIGPKVQIWVNDKLIWEEEVDSNPSKALADLLVRLCQQSANEIRTFAGTLKLKSHLPEGKSAIQTADMLVELLQNRHQIDDAFFQHLMEEYQDYYQLIRATQFRWADRLERAVGAACSIK